MRSIKQPFLLALLGLLVLLGTPRCGKAQMPLSPTAYASVLTCGPGDDFYTTFGHSALRIVDTANNIDLVYNYGTFDFSTPHFYWKFMRGLLDYRLSRTIYPHFILEYQLEGREVREQVLTFEPAQVANLYLLMEQNYLPEYRYYRYDFFRDNCATRIRDMVYNAWARDTLLSRPYEPRTYRRMVTDNLHGTLEWWWLGIDLLFGLPTDHRCTAPERMFLPSEMEAELAQCSTRKEWKAPFITEPSRQLMPSQRQPLSRSIPPVAVFALLLALVTVLSVKKKCGKWIDRTLFIVAGVLGLFLLFMWLGTDHWCTKWNLNVLWASPLLLLIAIRLERSPKWALWFQEICFLAATVWVLWCGLNPALLPIILMLALRTAMLLLPANRC